MSVVLRGGNPHEVLSEGFGLSLTRKDLQTLSHLNWLNDEVGARPSACRPSHHVTPTHSATVLAAHAYMRKV